MKSIFLYFSLISCIYCYSQQDCSFTSFRVALYDESGTDTAIRNEPNGEIILELLKTDYFEVYVNEMDREWLRVENIQSVEYGYEISNLDGWIHNSVVAVWTRRKANLLVHPRDGKTIAIIEGENGPLKIIDICADWVQIEFNGIHGWIEKEWLCGSPVTTCP
ncbi:MAG: SH3 domain-containing protein [Nonlabens sp.]|uniref:SH3 domain-containing protein n=1 Tax=Nonlabens sp. TaxID=1888209 RepID=UPI003EF3B7F0